MKTAPSRRDAWSGAPSDLISAAVNVIPSADRWTRTLISMSQQHAESYGPFGNDGNHRVHQRSGLEATTGPAIGLGQHADEPAAPFIWQDGPRLLLLVREGAHWTLAELHFITPECRYFERRRARYAWAREAAGAMLARATAAEPASRGRLARAVHQWVATMSPESVNHD